MSTSNYPEYRDELNDLFKQLGQRIPEPLKGFSTLSRTALEDGELTRKNKELIAVGIAVAKQCDGCIAYHVGGAVSAGASDEEIAETLGVALLMGGGPSSIYACEALKALNQYRQLE